MSTWAINQKKKCWNAAMNRWEDCQPVISRARGVGPPPPRKCCIPDECCVSCGLFDSMLQCFKRIADLPAYQLEVVPSQMISWGVGDIFMSLPTVNCRYQLQRQFPVGLVIIDTATNTNLTCYDDWEMTNMYLPMLPYEIMTQCFIFKSSDPNCPPLGICWKVQYVDGSAAGLYAQNIHDFKICINPRSVVDIPTFDACFSCRNSPTPPPPPPPCPNAIWSVKNITDETDGVVLTPDGLGNYNMIVNHDFTFQFLNLSTPACCGAPPYQIVGSAAIGIFAPNTFPINSPGFLATGHLEALTTPGVYPLFFEVLYPGCFSNIMKVTINVV